MPDYDRLIQKCKNDATEALKKEPLDYKDLVKIYQSYINAETVYLENNLGKDDRQKSRYAIYRGIYLSSLIDNLERENGDANFLFLKDPDKQQKANSNFQKKVKKQLNAIVDGSLFTEMTKYCLEAEHRGVREPVDKQINHYYKYPLNDDAEGFNFNIAKENIIGGLPNNLHSPVKLGTKPEIKEIIYYQHKLTRESLEMVSGMINKLNQGKEGVHNGSDEYDNIITAAKALETATKEMLKKQEYGGSTSQEQYDAFLKLEDNLSNSINVYLNKKEREYRARGGQHRNANSKMRTELVKSVAEDFKSVVDKNIELNADKHLYKLRMKNIGSFKKANSTDKLKDALIKDYYFRLLERDYVPVEGDGLGVINGRKKLLREKLSPSALEYGFQKFKTEISLNHKEIADDIDKYTDVLKEQLPTLTMNTFKSQLDILVSLREDLHLNPLSDVKNLSMPYITENKAKIVDSAALVADTATPKKDYMLEISTKLNAATKGVWGGTKEFDTLIKDADKIRLAERGINYNSELSASDKQAAEIIFDQKKALLDKMQKYVIRKYGEKMDALEDGHNERANSKMRRETVENMINLLTEDMRNMTNTILPEKLVPDDNLYKTKMMLFEKRALFGHDNLRQTVIGTGNLDAYDLAQKGPNYQTEFETLLGNEIKLAISLLKAGTGVVTRAEANLKSETDKLLNPRKNNPRPKDVAAYEKTMKELPPYSMASTKIIDKILNDYETYSNMSEDYKPGAELKNKLNDLRNAIYHCEMPDFILGGDVDGGDILERFNKMIPSGEGKEDIFNPLKDKFVDNIKFQKNEDMDISYDLPLGNDLEFEENPGVGLVDYLKNDDDVDEFNDKSESEFDFNPGEFNSRQNVGTRIIKDKAEKEGKKINLVDPFGDDNSMDGDNIININEFDDNENEIKNEDIKINDEDVIKIEDYHDYDPEDDLDLEIMTEDVKSIFNKKGSNRNLTTDDLDKILDGIEEVAQVKLEEAFNKITNTFDFRELTNCIYRTIYINDLKNNPDFANGKIKMNEDQLKQEMDDFVDKLRKSRYDISLKETLTGICEVPNKNMPEMTTQYMLNIGSYTGKEMIKDIVNEYREHNSSNVAKRLAFKATTQKLKEDLSDALWEDSFNLKQDRDNLNFLHRSAKDGTLKKIGIQGSYKKYESYLIDISIGAKNTLKEIEEKRAELDKDIQAHNAQTEAKNPKKNIIKKK